MSAQLIGLRVKRPSRRTETVSKPLRFEPLESCLCETLTPQVIVFIRSRHNEKSVLSGRVCAQGRQSAIPFCRFGISKKVPDDNYFGSRTWTQVERTE